MNMPAMFVTWEVSKLTGWLKFVAPCRGRKQGLRYEARCAGRKAGELGRVGQWRAQVAWTRRTSDWGAGGEGMPRAGERTANMEFMFVTRDVSKLTGWLKAAAACRG